MAVLVTGGGGYIGSQIVLALRERNENVVVLDTFERGHKSSVANTKVYIGDIRNSELVNTICKDNSVETVVHCAGYKSVPESFEIPSRYFDINLEGTKSLLYGIDGTSVRRIIFSSSCSVYGDEHRGLIDENCRLNPKSPYAQSKLEAEREIELFSRNRGVSWVILRFFNAAGASDAPLIGEDLRFSTTLFPTIYSSVLNESTLVLRGNDYQTFDGTGIRDYVHVVDLARAHLFAIEHLESGGKNHILNVGSGNGQSVLQILEQVEKLLARKIPMVFEGRRPGDADSLVANIDQIKKVIGWRPIHTIEDIVSSANRWYQSPEFIEMCIKR